MYIRRVLPKIGIILAYHQYIIATWVEDWTTATTCVCTAFQLVRSQRWITRGILSCHVIVYRRVQSMMSYVYVYRRRFVPRIGVYCHWTQRHRLSQMRIIIDAAAAKYSYSLSLMSLYSLHPYSIPYTYRVVHFTIFTVLHCPVHVIQLVPASRSYLVQLWKYHLNLKLTVIYLSLCSIAPPSWSSRACERTWALRTAPELSDSRLMESMH